MVAVLGAARALWGAILVRRRRPPPGGYGVEAPPAAAPRPASAPRLEACPGCSKQVQCLRKHMKRCCPELLPENEAGPQSEERQAERRVSCGEDFWITEEEVHEAAMRSVDEIEDPFLRKVLHLRFGLDRRGGDDEARGRSSASFRRTPAEVADALGGKYKGKPEAAQNLIRNALRSIPLTADDPKDLEVLYEDEDLLAVSKPPFLRTTPVHRFVGKSLTNQIVGYTAKRLEEAAGESAHCSANGRLTKVKPPPPLILHRLDQTTSGVVLCAKTKLAASTVRDEWHEDSCKKEYLAIAVRNPTALLQSCGDVVVVDAPIGADVASDDPVRRAVNHDTGQSAATRLEVLATSPATGGLQAMLLSCVLEESGRTHQIRVHAAHAGLPLLGDGMYGGLTSDDPEAPAGAVPPGRVALHAWRLRLLHPRTKEPMLIEAPLPEDLARCLAAWAIPRSTFLREAAPA